jgi:hypothetical protein
MAAGSRPPEPDLTLRRQIEYLQFVVEGLGDVGGLSLKNSRNHGEWARYF